MLEVVQSQINKRPAPDAAMDGDDRVTALESPLQTLETAVASHHGQQQKQNAEFSSQLAQVQQQVEQQGYNMQQHLDKRLTEQLGQIERLLLGQAGRSHE